MACWYGKNQEGKGARRVLYQFAEALDVLYAVPESGKEDHDLAGLDEDARFMFQDCGPEQVEIGEGATGEPAEFHNIHVQENQVGDIRHASRVEQMEKGAAENGSMESEAGASLADVDHDLGPDLRHTHVPLLLSCYDRVGLTSTPNTASGSTLLVAYSPIVTYVWRRGDQLIP